MSAAVIPYIPFNELCVIFYKLVDYKIGKGFFIGMRCYLDDMCFDLIRIGKDAVVGACSLVNKSVPACAIVVGIPATELKRELL